MNTIIQFPHPGKEHDAKSGKNWNQGGHKRKYLSMPGRYLTDVSSDPLNGNIYFWGEWEAQSYVKSISNPNGENFPGFIFEPYYQLPVGSVNTDPFVFGGQFYYCVCKQGHYPSLRNLNPGDMILFGSHLDGQFVLDTVFVVKGSLDYEIDEIKSLRNKYSSVFYDVSLLPMAGIDRAECQSIEQEIQTTGTCFKICDEKEDDHDPTSTVKKYRIYEAVMFDEKDEFDAIYSYFPCLNGSAGHNGFARPIINTEYVSKTLAQGIKIIENADVKSFWLEITKQVLDQELVLGVNCALPSKVD